MTFEQASLWAQENHIKSAKQWYSLKEKRPSNAPSNPDLFYKDKWEGWTKFLNNHVTNGSSVIERLIRLVLDDVFSPDEDDHRKQFIADKSQKKHYVDMCYPQINLVVEYDGAFFHAPKKDKDVSKTRILRKLGWNVVRVREYGLDVLDKKWNVVVKKDTSQEEKVRVVLKHLLSLSSKKLLPITSDQEGHLKILTGEVSFKKFFSKIGVHKDFVSYEECQQWAFDRQIKGEAHWRTFKADMLNDRIPYHPERTYKQQWVNWPQFLQNDQRSKKEKWATYQEASEWGRANHIKGAGQWYRLGNKRPRNLPAAPETVYEEWKSWPLFLGNGKRYANKFLPYQDASLWARQNNIKTGKDWMSSQKRPDWFPKHPDRCYKEWSGWGDFLGVANNYTKRNTQKMVLGQSVG